MTTIVLNVTDEQKRQIEMSLLRAKAGFLDKTKERKTNPDIVILALKELDKYIDDLI